MIKHSHYWAHTTILKDTCNPMFTTALFTITRPWKQPRHPLTDEWIKKLCYIYIYIYILYIYIYTIEYYSAMKKKAFESVLMRWMNLEPTRVK